MDPALWSAGRFPKLSGDANDEFFTLAYNPAGQITQRDLTNAAYLWTGAAAASDSYTSNGLNQYVSARGSTLAYDGRGTSEPVGRSPGNRSGGPISGGEGHSSGPPMTGPGAMAMTVPTG